MTKSESFGKKLFTSLANKLFREVNCDVSVKNLDCMKVACDFSKVNLDFSNSNDDVALSVLMLSYACRPAYMERFEEASQILMYDKGNPMIYVRTFEEAVLEKYSPLKLLMLCSFISEIFLFVSESHVLKIKHQYYLQQTTQALNEAFERIFEQGFPEHGWTDIQNEASKISARFKCLEPFINKATACQVAYSILTDNYEFETQTQQTDIIMPGNNSQQMVILNTYHSNLSAPGSQDSVNTPLNKSPVAYSDFENKLQETDIRSTERFSKQMVDINTSNCELSLLQDMVKIPEEPMDQLTDDLKINLTAIPVQNPVCTTKFPISFGTVDQDPQLLNLLHISVDQIGTVVTENKPSGIDPNFPVDIKATELFMYNPDARENSTVRNPENEQKPVFRTAKVVTKRGGEIEPSASNIKVIPVQELDNRVGQFGGKLTLTSESEFSDRLSQNYEENYDSISELPSEDNINNCRSEIYCKEKNVDHSKSQKFLTEKNSAVEQVPVFRIFKLTEDGGRELCQPNNELYSIKEFDDCYPQKWKNLTGSELEAHDNILWHSQSYAESDKDSINETFYECDSEIETLSEENFFDFESETYCIEKNAPDNQKRAYFLKRNPENEPEPVFRTVKITDHGDIEACPSANEVFSIQELDDCVAQFWSKLTLSSGSESEFQENVKQSQNPENDNDSKLETLLEKNRSNSENETLKENVDDSNLKIRIAENVHNPESGTLLFPRNLEGEEPVFRTVKTENEESKAGALNNEVNEQKEIYYVPLSSRIALERHSYGVIEHGNNGTSESFLKEEKDPISETFSKQNSFARGNPVFFAGNQFDAFRQRQNESLQVSLQKKTCSNIK